MNTSWNEKGIKTMYKSKREIEQDILERLKENLDSDTILDEILCYLDSDTTVEMLSDIANSYDVPVSDITDEDEDED